MTRIAAALFAVSFGWTSPALPQATPTDPDINRNVVIRKSQAVGWRQTTRTADTGSGEIGQRQTRDDTTSIVAPLGRITSRIESRVQNRLRNRLDRSYDPTASASTPFERAEARVRARSIRPDR